MLKLILMKGSFLVANLMRCHIYNFLIFYLDPRMEFGEVGKHIAYKSF